MRNHFLQCYFGGTARKIFFDSRFRFITTDFTLSEVKKYIPFISEKSGKAEKDIMHALSLLPLVFYQEQYYQETRPKAEKLIGARDPKDVDILALVLMTQAALWTEDKDFDGIPSITIIHTKDLL